MAHWFHRNPLKATKPLKFEGLQKSAKGDKCKEIITQLKAGRAHFLELVSQPSNAVDDVTVAFTEYVSLLRGLVDAPTETGGESKLRGLTTFKWTNTLGGRTPTVQTDAWFEVVSVVMQMAIWHTKHAASIAVSDRLLETFFLKKSIDLEARDGYFMLRSSKQRDQEETREVLDFGYILVQVSRSFAADSDPEWLQQDATFEKMGVSMAENGGRLLGLFDELAAFLTKIRLYNSRGLSDSHELAMFLELYNANPWTRTTVTGEANFSMQHTSLTVGGFNQPGVARSLIELPGNAEKGLSQRFLWFFPEPVYSNFDSLEPTDKEFREKLVTILASLWTKTQFSKQNPKRAFSLPSITSGETCLFKEQYDRTQQKLKRIAAMDDLLSGMLSKSLGQVLRVSAAMHVLFHVDRDEALPMEVSEAAIDAAIDFVDVCCQHTAYITGRGNINDELELLQSEMVARTPSTSNLGEKEKRQDTEAFVLNLPGQILDVSYLVNKQKKFRSRGGKEGALAAMRNLEEEGLGKLIVKSSKGTVKTWEFQKLKVPTDNAAKTNLAKSLQKYGVSLLEYIRSMEGHITLEEAKEVHRSLKLAAGMFLNVKDHLLPKLPASPEKGVDTDARVVEAYAQMSQGEAQEVTLARALELGHKPAVVTSLAIETSAIFTQACDALKTLDPNQFGKWTHYLTLKAAFYESYAYCFFGQELLAQEKCGDSVKVLQHSKALCDKATKQCERYSRTKGAGTLAYPERHPFFQKLGPMVKLHLDKSTRENGFIYYQKVPAELPELEKKQVYGLATPEDFALPPHHTLWSEEAYAAFHVVAESSEKYDTTSSASHEEIAPVPEPNIDPSKPPAPQTKSGCIIS